MTLRNLLVLTALIAVVSTPALADRRHYQPRHHSSNSWQWGAAGLLGGILIGSAISRPAPQPVYVPAPVAPVVPMCWVQTGWFYGQGFYTPCQ